MDESISALYRALERARRRPSGRATILECYLDAAEELLEDVDRWRSSLGAAVESDEEFTRILTELADWVGSLRAMLGLIVHAHRDPK